MGIPEMTKRGYPNEIAAGSIAAGGTLGILIPPSIMLILMASYSPLSVGELFAGAMIPGILLGLLYAVWVVIVAFVRPDMAPAVEPDEKVSRSTLLKMLAIEAAAILAVGAHHETRAPEAHGRR